MTQRVMRANPEGEIRERVRKLRGELEIHRLPSPERVQLLELQLLEQLVRVQDELILYLTEKAMK